ncbi:MAG: hypothetical protein R2827_08765 [Bdellovibrionales bacterium]
MSSEFDLSSLFNRDRFQQVASYFKSYLRNPVESVKSIPDWEWPIDLLTPCAVAALGGAIEGLIHREFLAIIISVIFGPIGAVLFTGVISVSFYYTFFFFFNRELIYRQIYTSVFICSIPIYSFQVLSIIAAPFMLIGKSSLPDFYQL